MKPALFNGNHRRLASRFPVVLCLLLAAVVAGCKPEAPKPPKGAYFQTPFQNECEFIVDAVVSDVAGQMVYAGSHRAPTGAQVSVNATEKPGSPADAPVYELQCRVGRPEVKYELSVTGPIWSPAVYEGLTYQLGQVAGVKPRGAESSDDTALLGMLTDGMAETIERENQRVSSALAADFTNPGLHEQAAVLLGAFMLRDHSGRFFELRSPLSRLTAHLAMAQYLRGDASPGVNGRLAEAMMLTLAGDETAALAQLGSMDTNDVHVLPWVRALRARNTGDYRPLDKVDGLSRIETVEWFSAWASYVSTSLAWTKLSEDQKKTIDFVREANNAGYSVEIGHQLLAVSLPLEFQEIANVYQLSRNQKLTRKQLASALNELPEYCFDPAGKVRVIGWGQWADFLQRHLCHAVQQNYYLMDSLWGVPDDAMQFAARCEQNLDDLRLYPFVRRFNCTNEASYHRAVDDAFKVTVATPQLVPAECWNYLCYRTKFAPLYSPNPNPHINEWHNHNPPPGTVYDLDPRLNHPSLVDRGDAVARFEQLHAIAPCDCRLSEYLVEHKYNNRPTYEQATNLFQAELPYGIFAMRTTANAAYVPPTPDGKGAAMAEGASLYEKLMLRAAALDPSCYYDLRRFEAERGNEDRAQAYLDQACAADPDAVRAANMAVDRVAYYVKKGQIEKARQIADDAGEAYSYSGLQAKGLFFELTSNYDGAFEWYAKIEERYNSAAALVAFLVRYKEQTHDRRFDQELEQRLPTLFPQGMKKVSLADFHAAPSRGVLIQGQNDTILWAGLRAGDVIVALDGTRVDNFAQYKYVRESLTKPGMNFIVWQGNGYHEIQANPPGHMFGVPFGDYRP